MAPQLYSRGFDHQSLSSKTITRHLRCFWSIQKKMKHFWYIRVKPRPSQFVTLEPLSTYKEIRFAPISPSVKMLCLLSAKTIEKVVKDNNQICLTIGPMQQPSSPSTKEFYARSRIQEQHFLEVLVNIQFHKNIISSILITIKFFQLGRLYSSSNCQISCK